MARMPRKLNAPSNDTIDTSNRTAKWMSALCYLNILILIPACGKWRHDDFVRFNLNQGVVLLAASTVAGALAMFPYTEEFGFWITLLIDVLSLVGLINVFRKTIAPLPVIGRIAENFELFK